MLKHVMMFTRRKALEERLARLEALIQPLAGGVPGASAGATLDANLAALLTQMLTAQTQTAIEREKINRDADLAAERQRAEHREKLAARSRAGGRKRAQAGRRQADGRFAASDRQADRLADTLGDPLCPLCIDPQTANFTLADLEAHQRHRSLREALINRNRINRPAEAEAPNPPDPSTLFGPNGGDQNEGP